MKILSWEGIRVVLQEQDKIKQRDNMFRLEAIARAQHLDTLRQVRELLIEKRKATTAQMGVHMKEKPTDKQNQMVFEQRLNILQELIGDMEQSKL